MRADTNFKKDWSIRRLENSKQPIAKLPTEIVLRICGYVVPPSLSIDEVVDADEMKSDWTLVCRKNPGDLINFTHVCHQWREVALGSPSSWSVLWVTDHRYSRAQNETFINRADKTPLAVAVHDEGFMSERNAGNKSTIPGRRRFKPFLNPMALIIKLFPNGPQDIKSLRVACHLRKFGGPTAKSFQKPAPMLESLAIHDAGGFHERTFYLPEELFANITPHLSRISLSQVGLTWGANLLKNLTFLRVIDGEASLVWGHPGNGEMVNLERLFEILGDCPNLITLELENVGPCYWPIGPEDGDDDGFLPSDRQINLPDLRNLILSGLRNSLSCRMLLRSLDTPNLRHLHVSTEGSQLHDITEFLPSAFKFHSQKSQADCAKLIMNGRMKWIEIELSVIEDLEKRLQLKGDGFSLGDAHDKADFKCRLRHEHLEDTEDFNEASFFQFSLQLLYRICPQDIQALTISNIEPWAKRKHVEMPYAEIFTYLNEVKCLEVRDELAGNYNTERLLPRFLKKLAQMAESDNTVALATVNMLIFDFVDFKPGSFKDLCFFLRHRKRRNAPISHLIVAYCEGLDSKSLATFESLVTQMQLLVDDESSPSRGRALKRNLAIVMENLYNELETT